VLLALLIRTYLSYWSLVILTCVYGAYSIDLLSFFFQYPKLLSFCFIFAYSFSFFESSAATAPVSLGPTGCRSARTKRGEPEAGLP